MKKKLYIAPEVQVVELDNVSLFATSPTGVKSDDLDYKGNADDDDDITSADAAINKGWELW